METDVTQERQQAHALLDMLPVEKLTAVVHLLQAISDPVARSLANAPIDDEPISEEEMRAVEASKEWLAQHSRTGARIRSTASCRSTCARSQRPSTRTGAGGEKGLPWGFHIGWVPGREGARGERDPGGGRRVRGRIGI